MWITSVAFRASGKQRTAQCYILQDVEFSFLCRVKIVQESISIFIFFTPLRAIVHISGMRVLTRCTHTFYLLANMHFCD